ncbi:MAG: GTP-sensing pleiotropic transcriptional regulator CodY [Syntrophomonadaceae bacterium]|nr:GTP-sensing pleiotropic transcriptional regulator CodY [Syntrophomonadaceae bacterium]
MEKKLLDKSRGINKIMQKINANPVDFFEMAEILAYNLESSVFIVGRRGQINGYFFIEDIFCESIAELGNHTERFPESFNRDFMNMNETQINISLEDGRKCIFNPSSFKCNCSHRLWATTPIFGGARRIGTIIFMRELKEFNEEDIVLMEYGAIVIANEIMRMRTERVEDEERKKASVQIALSTLSYSERDALEHVMKDLKGFEGLLVASRIADRIGITRSVIVSALRKLESAGVIESRSLGMKGTYIKVLNEFLFDEIMD